ncbi:actin-like ATPase domain-containing protein [Wilcoxina mikolae CBS 423.85]|nr:actin-like ATPase domain-containing protein [Wilcoxina mikolae CBS 423.85]
MVSSVEMLTPTDSNINPRFVVGVDFGTTFTSVAFAHTACPNDVELVRTWPGCGTGASTADQVPTEIAYTDLTSRTKKWGYEVQATTQRGRRGTKPEPLKWFKLLLQRQASGAGTDQTSARGSSRRFSRSDLTTQLEDLSLLGVRGPSTSFSHPKATPADKTARKLQEFEIAPVTVVTDFLRSVLEITKASMERTYDAQWVRSSTTEYVLTVPAIWSDAAKALMIDAAEAAGFGTHRENFNFIGEPESAAAYTLRAIQPNHLKVGDTFVICDAGGGTVDLVSYQITDLNPLRVNESVPGTGALCGSVFLDERFEQYIRGVLGDGVIDAMKPVSKNGMMRSWEEAVKFQFGNTAEGEEFFVSVPGIPDNDETEVESGHHMMQWSDVKKIFDPVVDRIIELVKGQMDDVKERGDKVAAVLLVGGFGSSEYLRKRLQGFCGANIQVLQPTNARTSIVRGALIRGLSGSIVRERRARRFYGTCISIPCTPVSGTGSYRYWDSGLGEYRTTDPSAENEVYWDYCDEEWMIPGSLSWFIKKGIVVGDDESVSIKLERHVRNPSTEGALRFEDPLMVCNHSIAPDFSWRNPSVIMVFSPQNSLYFVLGFVAHSTYEV